MAYNANTPQYPNSVKTFGAAGDGVTDDTAAIQAAVNVVVAAGGGALYVPNGAYKTSSPISITGPIDIIGYGRTSTRFVPATNISCFNISTNSPVYMEGFAVNYATQAAPGTAAINVTSIPTGTNVASGFRRLNLVNAYIGINFIQAQEWLADDVRAIDFSFAGIEVNNNTNVDQGNAYIQNCTFNTTIVPAAAGGVVWVSGGGLWITASTFLGGGAGLNVAWGPGVSTTDLFVQGNSFEAQTGSCIQMTRSDAFGFLGNIVITGNEFGFPGTAGVLILPDAHGSWLTNLNISDNIFASLTSGVQTAFELASCSVFSCCNNTILTKGTATVTPCAIDASATRGSIGPFISNGTNISPIFNASTSVFVNTVQQSGTGNVTTSTPFGALFAGSISVTFPTPFTSVPTVNTNLTSNAGGGVSAQAGSITKTGFTLTTVGQTNGGVTQASWTANGMF